MELVSRQEKTLDGLRERLYNTLDQVILGKIKSDQVECICAISEQIVNSAQLEVDTIIKLQHERRIEEDRRDRGVARLGKVIDSLQVAIDV